MNKHEQRDTSKDVLIGVHVHQHHPGCWMVRRYLRTPEGKKRWISFSYSTAELIIKEISGSIHEMVQDAEHGNTKYKKKAGKKAAR